MKILILSDDFPPNSFGGAGIIASSFAKAFEEKGHFVFVITAVQDRASEGEFEYEGLKVFRIYSKYHERFSAYLGLYNPLTVSKVKKIIKEIKPDIVHANNLHYHLSYYCLRLAKQNGARVFLTAHDAMLFHYGKLSEFLDARDSPREIRNYKISAWQQLKKFKKRYNPFRNLMIKFFLRYVDRIFAVSYALKEALSQNGIENVEVVHNGIDADRWLVGQSAVDGFKEKYNLRNKKVILFGGRLSGAKGGTQAIRMLVKVVKDVPDAILLVIGRQDSYANHMIELACSLNVDEHVIFTGWISGEELRAAYHVSDIVCVLSLYLDPFPTINLEAMACKRPVVATCFGGSGEVVRNNVTGYVVNPYKINDLESRVTELLLDLSKAERFGLAGYKKVKNEFNLQKITAGFLDRLSHLKEGSF